MISIWIVLYLLFLHWAADFVCQSDWMAKNKSTDNKALLLHCGTYFLIFFMGTLGLYPNGKAEFGPLFSFTVGLIHFPVDYYTSRVNKQLWDNKDVHGFFVSIGFDQLIHFATILLAWQWVAHKAAGI